MENFWHAEPQVAVERFYVLDAATNAVSRYTQSIQAYKDNEYAHMLQECGFRQVQFYSSLTAAPVEGGVGLVVITGRKGDAGNTLTNV